MNKTINLWSCLTNAEMTNRRHDIGPDISSEDLKVLGTNNRFHGQELTLQAVEEGWELKVFGCWSNDSDYRSGITILIPKDHFQPVKVIKDRVGRLEHHHD